MANIERPDQDRSASTASDFSMNNFFHDAYNKGIVNAVEERPREAAVTVVGAAAAAAAAIYVGRSEIASGLFRGGAAEEAGQLMMPATKSLVAEGLPIRGATLDFTGRTAALATESPTSLMFGGKPSSATSFEALLRETRPANNLDFADVRHTVFSPTATATGKAEAIMDTAHGIKHTTFGAAATLEEKAGSILGSATGHGAEGSVGPFTAFDQGNYRFVPTRSFATEIRLGNGPTMTSTEGPSKIIFGDNSVQHIRFNSAATDAEKADLILKAGYADLINGDRLAYEAAGKTMGQSIGFHSQPIERFASLDELQENAIKGASAYVDGDAAAANGYTHYLTERYGPMTRDSLEWGRHIVGDGASPASVWNTTMAPATDTLVGKGLPINAVNRAMETNPTVLTAQPWLRSASIRGGVQYMEARAAESFPTGASPLISDAWYGNQAKVMAPEVVRTLGAVTGSLGEKACADTALIDKVAKLVGQDGKPEDYVNAYKALQRSETILSGGGH